MTTTSFAKIAQNSERQNSEKQQFSVKKNVLQLSSSARPSSLVKGSILGMCGVLGDGCVRESEKQKRFFGSGDRQWEELHQIPVLSGT